MSEKEIKVVGMHCPSCVTAVELCLKDVDGIDDAKADLDTGITKITLSADVMQTSTKQLKKQDLKLNKSSSFTFFIKINFFLKYLNTKNKKNKVLLNSTFKRTDDTVNLPYQNQWICP